MGTPAQGERRARTPEFQPDSTKSPGTHRGRRRPSQCPSCAFQGTEGTAARPFGFSAEKCASRWEGGTQPTRARLAPVEFGSGDELDGRGWCLVPRGPESRDPGEGGTWPPWPVALGEGADRSAFLRDRLEPAGDGMGQGWGRRGQTQGVLTPSGGLKLSPPGFLGSR